MSEIDLFIHTPTYDGTVTIGYAFGLLQAMRELGVSFQCASVMGALIARNRDELTTQFAESDCSHMLCIDADVHFDTQDVAALIRANRGVVAGCYPRKNAARDIPAKLLEGEEPDGPLVKCDFVPAGFMLVRRDVIKQLRESLDDSDMYAHGGKAVMPLWHPLDGNGPGSRAGEDVSFCRRVRAIGRNVWLHTGIRLKHQGTHVYEIPEGPLQTL